MCRVVDQVGRYKILKTSSGYIVSNTKGSYSNHGHFKKLKTCYLIIKLIQRRQIPRSRYLRGSAIRISADRAYVNKVKHKVQKDKDRQRYHNSQKGVRL